MAKTEKTESKKNGKSETKPATKTQVKSEFTFKKGMIVAFKIKTGAGLTKGKGKIEALPPSNPGRGENRFSVKDDAGKVWHPYTTQCQVVK